MINKVILIGRSGKDATMHTTKSEKNVTRFTLATWENYRDETEKTGWRTETEWHNIVVWGTAAETLYQNVKTGTWVYVEGSIRTRSYEDNMGVKKWITEIVGYGRVIKPEKAQEIERETQQLPQSSDTKLKPDNFLE